MSLTPSSVIVAVHGVRSHGEWTDTLEAKLEADPRFKDALFWAVDYPWTMAVVGWAQTWWPWSRHTLTNWMERQLVRIQAQFPDAPLDIVSHSYGTWLTWHAIRRSFEHATPIRARKVLMLGSVVHHDGPFFPLVRGQIKRLVNFFSLNDTVVLFAPPPFGHAGQVGCVPTAGIENVGDCGMKHNGYFDVPGVWARLLDELAT